MSLQFRRLSAVDKQHVWAFETLGERRLDSSDDLCVLYIEDMWDTVTPVHAVKSGRTARSIRCGSFKEDMGRCSLANRG